MPAFSTVRAQAGRLTIYGDSALRNTNETRWHANNVDPLLATNHRRVLSGCHSSIGRAHRSAYQKSQHSLAWGQAKAKRQGLPLHSIPSKFDGSQAPEAFNYQGTESRGDEIPDSNVLVGPPPVEFKRPADIEYLQELLAIQQSGPKAIGFFGTRNMGFMHQQLIEILSYAMVLTSNHIFTSGATGTNAAVIRGALRAEKPDLLTVVLPQSLSKQPPESQELLKQVKNLIETPHNDHLQLIEASRLCNRNIISKVQQIICFAFHDSHLLMETCQEAKDMRKIVTLLYLD
ncbi:hypothetical protein KFL_002850100 [Klebsormidium nitens]|uniref:Uncharacterized protein n=1 Tax=Klebsormidium nitens TaxID=105231 RepID=A0A1Y1ICC8_KLENI|nr:hypothetical protein KFL_002850100 [Klebsormidium nitens]|eukprot:GAQ86366.1 hypothetical protein KFL_002850100 [Klebsormidium nitens]